MSVGFLLTVVRSLLSGPGETKVTEKDMDPSELWVYAVNGMLGSMELIYCETGWLCSALLDDKGVIQIPEP